MTNRRLLMICGDFPPTLSGVGDYTDRLCHELTLLGTDVTVLTSAHEAVANDAARDFNVLREMRHWGWSQRHTLMDIACDFDLVHMQYPSVTYGRGPGVNLVPLLIRSRRVPCVLTIHDFRVMRKRWRLRTVPMLSVASGLVHVDAGDGPYLRRWSPVRHAPMTCIPIASNAPVLPCDATIRATWREGLGFTADELVVAYFGILYPHKGVPEMLDAVAALRAEGHRVRPLVIGDFDRQADYVAGMTTRLNEPGVTWVRGATLERVSECLHAADLACLPFYSGASFNRSSMLAALQHGLPTVTTNGPATPPSLTQTYDLSMVPPQDTRAVTEALRKLLDQPALRQKMRESAIRATESLNWPAVARSHQQFYERVLAGSRTEGAREDPQRA